MSLGFGFGSGLRALSAARLGMQTAGNNIANANTLGYTRQRVELSASMPYQLGNGFQIGSGVEVGGIFGMADQGLERRLQLQMGLVGAARVDQMRFNEIEGILSEPDGGLSQSLQGMFGSIASLQTDPADRALRGGVLQAGSALSQGFRLIADRFGELSGSTFTEVRGLVRQVNERAAAIAELNSQITALESNGSVANDLRDARGQHIKEISELLDTRAIERNSGSVDLLVGGHLLVAGGEASKLSVGKAADGKTKVIAGASATPAAIREGRIAALLRQEAAGLPELTGRIDALARNTILEFNRMHSTGMPRSGPFSTLTSSYGSLDRNGNNIYGDELLSQAGFEFDVQQGSLYIGVTDRATGAMERSRIDIDPKAMTLQDVATAITGIDHLTASIDPTGKLRVSADAGYGFDFSPRLDPNPDGSGTFGGANPSIGSQSQGPFNLASQAFPVTFTVTTGTAASPINTTVTLQAADFGNTAAATTDELVAAINDDLGANATASNVGGRLLIQSAQGGTTARLQLANGAGTALGDLGLSTTATTGRDAPVAVAIEGSYTGATNESYTFAAVGDGTIGRTPGLSVNVFNSAGQLVNSINVGQGYQPGDPIEVGDGVSVSFGPGAISGTSGQAFSLEALADSDTSDLLVSLGMNAFFLGSSASDIAVNPALLGNPDRLSAGLGMADGDASNLSRMMGLRDLDLADLGFNTIEDYYADIVGDTGFDTAAATNTLQAQELLLSHLQAERESISGVNIDEEMVTMMQYQQSYEAAARFISVAQEMTDTLINLGR